MNVDAAFISTHEASEVMEPVWWNGNIYEGLAAYERCLKPFSRGQRLMWALLWYQAEVDNGGHDQFFFNSTGIVYPDALAALEELGLEEAVGILSEAGRRMGGNPSRDREERVGQLDRVRPEFDDLDARFFAFEKNVSLGVAMLDYMRAHVREFAFRGTIRIPKGTLELRKRLQDATQGR